VSSSFEIPPVTRRDFVNRVGMGFGALGLALTGADAEGARSQTPLAPRKPHFPARAKRVIHVFLNGGPSHIDTFDPKPLLTKYHGKELPVKLATERPTGAAFKSPFTFGKYGQSGMDVSEIFPHLAQCMDDLTMIRSMHTDLPNHEPAMLQMNCGATRLSRPSMGSWITYGLGSENQNLPGYVAICPGLPVMERLNWRSSFLPGVLQGTHIDTRKTKVEDLIEHIRHGSLSLADQRAQLDLLLKMNQRHSRARNRDPQLEARIQSFELAYRMQMEATDAFDVTQEPSSVREMYGDNVQGRQLLMARRLVERGVRFVQVFQGHGQPWDSHEKIGPFHRRHATAIDRPVAALLNDLKQRGMLDETLVIIGGEFGRTPVVELPRPGFPPITIDGRDHNHYGFNMILAGGGVKRGYVHGSTDEFGFEAVEKKVHVHDLHATILHLLGLDHKRLTYRHAGRDIRLTDIYGNVVHDVIA
jgi:hypothetical protein